MHSKTRYFQNAVIESGLSVSRTAQMIIADKLSYNMAPVTPEFTTATNYDLISSIAIIKAGMWSIMLILSS
jgi:hypothetical protein